MKYFLFDYYTFRYKVSKSVNQKEKWIIFNVHFESNASQLSEKAT